MKLFFTLLTTILFCHVSVSSNVILIDGCTDTTACNYDPAATVDDGSCLFLDGCGDCGGTGIAGCLDPLALNYNPSVTCETGSCIYPLAPNCRDFAFVPNADSASVSVIDIANDVVVNTIAIGINPIGVDVCPATDRVFVASREANDVYIIEASSGTLLASPSCGLDPWAVGCTSDGQKLVITGNAFSGPDEECRVMDLNTFITTSVPIADSQSGVVISPDDTKAYLALSHDSVVAVLDLTTNVVTDYLEVGINPNGIDISADGNTLYVANYNDESFTIYDLLNDTGTDVSTGPYPEGIEISPDQSQVAVAIQGDNTVQFYDLASQTSTIVPVGIDPNGVSFANEGAMLVTTMQGGDMVYNLDAVNHVVLDSIGVGGHPKALGNFVIPICGGCTDPLACNYDPLALNDDGSCDYTDSDGDGTFDCDDGCPNDPNKIAYGICGCGAPDIDTDGDGLADCACRNIGYIPNSVDNTVSVVDLDNNVLIDTWTGFDEPIGIHVCEAANRVFVPSFNSDIVHVIEASTGTTLQEIPVPNKPWTVTATPNAEILCVAGGTVEGLPLALHDFYIINFACDTVVVAQTIGESSDVVISPDQTKAYATLFHTGNTVQIDLATGVVDTSLFTGDNSYGLDISEDGNFLYVGAYSGHHLSIVNLSDYTIAPPIPLGEGDSRPTGLAISPDESTVAIALQDNNRVAFYHIEEDSLSYYDVGIDPSGVSYTGDGSHLAVSMVTGNEVWNINLNEMNHAISPLGQSPYCFGEFVANSCSGCSDPEAPNYDMSALYDDQSCLYPICGCTYPTAANYNSQATIDNGSCDFGGIPGCTYVDAENYDPTANEDNGSCTFDIASSCPWDTDENGYIDTLDLLNFLSYFGLPCQ